MEKPIPTLLLADDDPDFRVVAGDAFKATGLAINLKMVGNAQELMDYLCRRPPYSNPKEFPTPGVMLIDLKMPGNEHAEVLKQINEDAALRQIPLVVLSSSTEKKDVSECYALGVTSFIVKPAGFSALVDLFKTICGYWFEVAQLPPQRPTNFP
jgi:CheY-like chemotaxis protein